MGHKISKEQIDPGVKDRIMSFVGDVADLETEVNTDIISAVNSLLVDRVDNAENMGKLANAIGEPVTANHSVDEVVEGLGEMLSTFKTNMMNSGVMVESSDKFKQLIDKIKGLTEGEGNKGIQFASGEIDNSSIDVFSNKSYTIQTDLSFTPNYIFVYTEAFGMNNATNVVFSNINPITVEFSSYGTGSVSITDITSSAFNINYTNNSSYSIWGTYNGRWYAIGVGEEDTTLRDSLASILIDEGVNVTEEDNMASLITKVDEEFDRKNNEIENIGGLDIICATELPNEVVNNQVVLITDVEPSIIKLTTVEKCNPTVEGEINISYNVKENLNPLYISQGNILTVLYLYQAKLYNNDTVNILPAYIGVDNTWKDLNETLVILDAENRIANSEYFNNLTCTWSSWGSDEPGEEEYTHDYFNYNGVSSDTGILSFEGYVYGWYGDWYNNSLSAYLQSSFSIDTSLYTKLIVEAKTTLPSPEYGLEGEEDSVSVPSVIIGFYSEGAGDMVKSLQLGNKISGDYVTYELDISSLNTNYYFGLYVYEYIYEGDEGGVHVDIKRIELVK